MECQQSTATAVKCPCTYVGCERRGACCKCVSFHRSRNQMVACYFTPEAEATYDRSMDNFLKQFK